MHLTIELPDDQGESLRSQAERHGVSPENYARVVIEEDLKKHSRTSPKLRHISEIMADIIGAHPPEPPRS